MKKIFSLPIIFSLLLGLTFSSCSNQKKVRYIPRPTWYAFSSSRYNSVIYVSLAKEMFSATVCGKIDDYYFSQQISHACNGLHFEEIKTSLLKNGFLYLGTAAQPNIDGYPDLSKFPAFALPYYELKTFYEQIGIE